MYSGSNFFAFLLAASMRCVYEKLLNGNQPPDTWLKLAMMFRPAEITEEPVRARFLEHCMRFYGLEPCFPDTPGVRAHLASGKTIQLQHEFNYKLAFDLERKSVVVERRKPQSGDKFTAVFEACDSGDYLLLASLAIRATIGAEDRHIEFADILSIYETRSLRERAGKSSRKLTLTKRKKAHSNLNSLRRRLKAKGVDPEDIFVAHKSGVHAVGIVLRPTVKTEGLSTVSTRHAISNDDYPDDEGATSILDRKTHEQWKHEQRDSDHTR